MRNVLTISTSFWPVFGGMEQQAFFLSKKISELGYSVDILTERKSRDVPLREVYQDLKVYRLRFLLGRKLGYPFLILQAAAFLLYNRDKYDLIICRKVNIYSVLLGMFKMFRLLKATTLVMSDSGGENDEFALAGRMPFSKAIIFLLNQNDFFNCINEDNFRHCKEFGFNIDKCVFIPLAVDIGPFKYASYPKQVKTFLFLARLVHEKGIMDLLFAFSKLVQIEKARLIIAGDGSARSDVERFICRNSIQEFIEFKGYIDGEEKEEVLRRADCLVLPSYHPEGFPISIIESAIRKRLIISTEVGDLKKVFGERIIYCKPKDSDDLMSKMLFSIREFDLSSLDYQNKIAMFDVDTIVNRILSLAFKN
jgi:glycosyltransferase involved in cell wall biosynthesis